ncbi:putative acetyltransferase [Streptomyces sp. ADI96-02]|uniref:GNAT family N-acetyltransferase n=1 Tax=unclassified Streptomyces TaxID=2593676 RepID=UPI000FB13E01|nr:GNAT family N-acetyltransferase [Streptomyces sp. ADI96-02]RPK54721.1 putative acetyltransferase [Streptomyces sp. ADI96-02]
MSSFTTHVLEPADWRLYRALRLAALTDAPQEFGSTLAREEALTEDQWRRRLEGRGQFVARQDGDPCGIAGVVPAEPRVAELVSVWVRPRSRGQGVGGLLLDAALGWAEEHGCVEVRLTVSEGNDAAERLYSRHGFRRTAAGGPAEDAAADRREFAMVRTEHLLRGGPSRTGT